MNAETIIRSLNEIAAHERGELKLKTSVVAVPAIDVRKLREELGVSQEEFAGRYNLAVATVRNWEQGLRQPDGPGRMFSGHDSPRSRRVSGLRVKEMLRARLRIGRSVHFSGLGVDVSYAVCGNSKRCGAAWLVARGRGLLAHRCSRPCLQ